MLAPLLGGKCLFSLKLPIANVIPIESDYSCGKPLGILSRGVQNSDFAKCSEDKIIILTLDGKLSLFQIDGSGNDLNSELLDEVTITGVEDRQENALSVTVCSKGRFVLVNMRKKIKNLGSCFVVYEITLDNKFEQRAIVDFEDLELASFNLPFWCLEFALYQGTSPIFAALSNKTGEGAIFSLKYDPELEEILVVDELFRHIQRGKMWKLTNKKGSSFAGICSDGNLIEIDYKTVVG